MRLRLPSSSLGEGGPKLAEAHRRLMFLRNHAGEEYRETILENVPLHRDSVAAWEEHGRE